MISSLKGQDLYEVSIGIGKYSYEDENECLNDVIDLLEQYVGPFLQACATLLILLNTQRISRKNWTETLESTMRMIIKIRDQTQKHKSSLVKIIVLYSL